MVFSSLFSVRAINLRIRVVIALVLTVFIAMQIEIPRIDPITAQGLEVVFQQIFIGFTMGMIMQIATASTVIAGQLVSGSMGLTMANMIDPTLGNVPVIAGFFTILSTLIFMTTVRSFDCLWYLAGIVSAIPHWGIVLVAGSLGQDDQLEQFDVPGGIVDCLAGGHHLAVCEHWFGIRLALGTQSEHFFRRLSRHGAIRVCRVVAGGTVRCGAHQLDVGA